MSGLDRIADIQPGRCNFRGRVTSVDANPTTVAVGREGRVTPLFHFGVTDASGTIQGTAWDRNQEHRRIRIGAVVVVRGVVAKLCRAGFDDYHACSFNFGRQSVLEIEDEDDTTLPLRERPRPANELLLDGATAPKRHREPSSERCCPDPSEPFCSSTGRPHDPVCPMCGSKVAKKPFCPKTGLRHE